MRCLLTFLEGIISFLSPCMLPLLPVYISYFAGGTEKKGSTLWRALAFVLGFMAVFCLLGVFAGSVGAALRRWQRAVDLICGLIVILLGLSYLELFRLPFFNGAGAGRKVTGLGSAFLFGLVYSVSLTPCVGAFLGSALMLASSAGGARTGALLLLCYSLGLGLPFLLSALLLEKLGSFFDTVKRHYTVLNRVCGVFLIAMGLLMATGQLNRWMAQFS